MNAIDKMLRTSYLEFGSSRTVIGLVADGSLRQMEWRDKIQPRYWPRVEAMIADAEEVIRGYHDGLTGRVPRP
jgi:hypothetical protein